MILNIKQKIFCGLFLTTITLGIIVISLFNSYQKVKKENKKLQQELSNQILYIEQKSQENKKLQDKYNNIVISIKSDECGKQEIPQYLKDAIQEILK